MSFQGERQAPKAFPNTNCRASCVILVFALAVFLVMVAATPANAATHQYSALKKASVPTATVTTKNVNHQKGTFSIVVSNVKSKSKVKEVLVPVWSKPNQADLRWYKAKKLKSGNWKATIRAVDHYMAGTYYVHVYVKTANGKSTCVGANNGKKLVVSRMVFSGDKELDRLLRSVLKQTGSNLRSIFNYVAALKYEKGSLYPKGNWSIRFAKEMLKNKKGNCYRYAAAMAWLAKAVGYDAKAISGGCPTRSGGSDPHGWTEIVRNGVTYVCDSDMVHAFPRKNWYMVTYADAPIAYIK